MVIRIFRCFTINYVDKSEDSYGLDFRFILDQTDCYELFKVIGDKYKFALYKRKTTQNVFRFTLNCNNTSGFKGTNVINYFDKFALKTKNLYDYKWKQ